MFENLSPFNPEISVKNVCWEIALCPVERFILSHPVRYYVELCNVVLSVRITSVIRGLVYSVGLFLDTQCHWGQRGI